MDNEQGKGNPPFMTVNTQLDLTELFADRPERTDIVIGVWEAVDERR